ncbi:hypothetical protein [Halobacillus salinarum]|nr:hypothetical protein [Halobacillus salinarum]
MKKKIVNKNPQTPVTPSKKPIVINSSSIKRLPMKKGGCCGKRR